MKLYHRILTNKLGRGLVGFFVTFFALLFILAVIMPAVKDIYYQVMPGNWFVDYYKVTVGGPKKTIEIGQPLQTELCRKLRYKGIKLDATRTFLYRKEDGAFKNVSQYSFEPFLESTDIECLNASLPASRQPAEPGIYKFFTEASFYVNGEYKTISYTSNEYKAIENQTTIEKKIKELQDELDFLKNRSLESTVNETSQTDTSSQTTTNKSSAPQTNLNTNQSQTKSGQTQTPQPVAEMPQPTKQQGLLGLPSLINDNIPFLGGL